MSAAKKKKRAPPAKKRAGGTSSSTRTEVRSPTKTDAYTAGNFTSTVTGGAGAGATRVDIRTGKKRNAKAKAHGHPASHECKRCASTRRDHGRGPKKHAAKRAPARARNPPRGWWDECIARVERRDGASACNARAACGAAWWKLPASKRRAIVGRLERSQNPADRRAAHAIARAERSRAHRVFKARRPRRRAAAAPRRNPPKQLVSLVYKEQKPGDERPYEYEHDFSRGARPKLVERRGRLVIKGGGYEMKDGWIHG